jgi:hypothetical protein
MSRSAVDGIAVVSSTMPQPAGFAFLGKEIFAVDYRGAMVTFRGEFRAQGAGAAVASRAGLFLWVVSGRDVRQSRTERAAADDPDNTIVTISTGRGWTNCRVSVRVPDGANTVVFGIFLAGPGRIEMRDTELAPSP